jgi:hypothetical protein
MAVTQQAIQANVVNWFEIPVLDLQRAKLFYETVLSFKMTEETIAGETMALFPYQEGHGSSGALVAHQAEPSQGGTLLYFTSPSGDAAKELARVERAGGKVITPKTLITEEIGYCGYFLDTEGNRVALHSHE